MPNALLSIFAVLGRLLQRTSTALRVTLRELAIRTGRSVVTDVPKGARLEATIVHPAGDVALYDVSHLLPTRKGRPQPKRPTGARIERLYVHKSGGEGRGGFAGLLGSARYTVTRRGFPGMPYTFWAGRRVDRDAQGRPVLYRGAPDDARTWHTGGACNVHGIALALQGNLSARDLTADQRHVAEAALIHVLTAGVYPDLDDARPVSTHSRAKRYGAKKNKSICPGEYAEAWLDAWLGENGFPGLEAAK